LFLSVFEVNDLLIQSYKGKRKEQIMYQFYNSKNRRRPQLTLVSDQATAPPPLVKLIKGYIIRNVAAPLRITLPKKPAK
jgi:hypothetical protein